jgi:hypothetical protein
VQHDRPITVLDWAGDVAQDLIRTYERVTDQLAALQVAAMLTLFMDANEGRWPSCWEDLRGFYAFVTFGKAGDDAFSQLSQRVWINFGLVPTDGFIRLLYHTDTVFFGVDLNERILKYRRVRWGGSERDNEVWDLDVGGPD